ncbi:MAG TPA: Arc family DNA-binding protein [Ottowia sp.]|uniref:FitA-like ribbon-helix-helix domain-containing protein n=1 Tax=Ottowia sp. TaxID=1898956 RepID=UPI0011D67262|nr:Arc family DNA-binding protein [Ottowia sp.]TXI14020.1 MAG: Arc family DNA-binding protein [Ottowia sp.]HNR83809.1 Arc family DNA-binding protein [Ottowia sp.]HOZ94207.1 Arc family DNA-binding protein [Ottowia sp.]HQO53466.1 Arc family DNA-binding protein [Ottowia sp.]
MTTLTIKDVPEPLAQQLRQRAARNHRSLQGELMSIIEQAVQQGDQPGAGLIGTRTLGGGTIVGMSAQGPIVRRGYKTIEQIYDELRAKYPEPIENQCDSVQLIREDRDSR